MSTEVIYYGADSPQAGQIKEIIQHPDPDPVAAVLTEKQFRLFTTQILGSPDAVGSIWKLASTSLDNKVQYAFMAWSKAITYELNDVIQLTSVLTAGGCMSAQQRDLLINNWPMV